jgi:DNA-binding NtrC family response regulator
MLEQTRHSTDDGAPPRAHHAAPLVLAWQEPGRPPKRLALTDELISLGSHPDNSIVLESRLVSRFHCRVHLRPDRSVWLRDLGSKNGTQVDGARVLELELAPGARLKLGDQELRVEGTGLELAVDSLPGMVARDPGMAEAIALLRRAAGSRLPVILRGDTGTGKEVAARALHALSSRAQGPFVPINCGAIAKELAEAELFGHERGAFTGAVSSSPGAFGAADQGTLFLDEIGELPLALQVKLLRALESDEVKPVGAARPRKVDARIVCATHRDLRALVRSGAFREDLYYRLQGVEIVLPPLRARPRDILAIAEKLLAREGDSVRLAPDAKAALLGHSWPGNARELVHALRLALLLREGPQLHASDLRLESPLFAAGRESFSRCSESDGVALYAMPPSSPSAHPLPAGPAPAPAAVQTLDQLEAHAIRAAYQRHAGHRRAMASELGIAKSSLLRKLTALGLRG